MFRVKNDLKRILEKTENLNKEISKQDERLEEVKLQNIQIEQEIGQVRQELETQQISEEDKLKKKEERKF